MWYPEADWRIRRKPTLQEYLTIAHISEAAEASQPGGYLEQGATRPLKRRVIGLSIALAIEALLLLLLFTLGYGVGEEDQNQEDLVTFSAQDFVEDAPSEPEPEPQQQVETPPPPVDTPPEPVPDVPVPEPVRPEPVIITPPVPAPPPPPPAPTPPKPPSGPPRVYGPPSAGPPGPPDSARVGTASNGEPLYAARWYREPTDQELAGYLSTASGPGSALIECRTVSDFRVEDCSLLGEVPRGSQIGRAVLAAAWQFRVRPARVGGRSQVGSWVRIRIDYTRVPRP